MITGSIDALKAMANTSSYASAKHGLVGKLSFPAGILNFESSCGVCDG